ncbi:MAG: rRNA synthase [Acidobacteriota bacterium]|jgi:23S rRNA pseudouridine1911/1915/1917 synthase|nr:rRNA synthase [Acidobacteriota bacterium]
MDPVKPIDHAVTAAQAGQTVPALLRELLPGTSWSRAKELVQSGRVRVDGSMVPDPATRVAAGSRIELRPDGPSLPRGPLAPDALVHFDADLVVVDKPAGLLTVPFAGERDTLITLTRTLLARREGEGRGPALRAVQRLDKETSGLVVFARSVPAERLLQEQFKEHSVLRRYLGLVHGAAESGSHETLLLADRGDGLRGSWGVFRRAKGEPPPTARRAVTHVQVVERLRGATLVACELETGRQHQIRIHLAEAGHPLLGERVYVRDYRGPVLPAPRPMLHAALLGFDHPRGGRPVRFEVPVPADFLAMLARLRG